MSRVLVSHVHLLAALALTAADRESESVLATDDFGMNAMVLRQEETPQPIIHYTERPRSKKRRRNWSEP
jgi:hypothetical protein